MEESQPDYDRVFRSVSDTTDTSPENLQTRLRPSFDISDCIIELTRVFAVLDMESR